jgi:hypothetical protein
MAFNGKKLEFYGIGPTFRKRIKSFSTDISGAVINNGHLSKLFLLKRDRQGIIYIPTFSSLERLSAALK